MSTSQKTEVRNTHVKFATNVGYFDKYLEALEAFRDEGIVVFNDNMVFSKVTDPAGVAMCVSRIKGQALNSLKVEDTEEIKVGLDFDKVRECLKGTSNTSELEVTWPVTDSGSDLMRLDIIDEDLKFEITTPDTDTIPDIPQKDPLSYNTVIEVDGSQLKKAVKHADKIADDESGSLIFETFDNVFQVRCSDKVQGKFSKQFYSGPTEDEELDEEHQSEISMSYLEDVKNALGRGDSVKIHIKDQSPIRFDVPIDQNGDAQVIYLIAPRLKSQ